MEKGCRPTTPKENVNADILLEIKKSHKDSVLVLENFKDATSSDVSPHLFFSGSEDRGVRLWDLRAGGAVKLFQSPLFTDGMSCMIHAPKSQKLFVANSNNVLAFDLRINSPIVKQATDIFSNPGDDNDINCIAMNRSESSISLVDDQYLPVTLEAV